MDINNAQRDGRAGARGKYGGGQSQNKDDKGLSDERARRSKETMEAYEKEEDDLENYQSDKERKGWDLKF